MEFAIDNQADTSTDTNKNENIDLLISNPLECINELVRKESGELDAFGLKARAKVFQLFQDVLSKDHDDKVCSDLTCEENNKLVSFTAMIQHDSLGGQYFIPFGQDSNGNYFNIGMYTCHSNQEESLYSSEEEQPSNSPVHYGKLMERTMLIVTNLPEEIRWKGKMLVFSYDDAFTSKVNAIVKITGILNISSKPIDDEYPFNLPTIHAINISLVTNSSVEKPLDNDLFLLRKEIVSKFEACFGLDTNHSKLLLFSLLGRVSSRSTGLLTSLLIGTFPLNIRISKDDEDSNTAMGIQERLKAIFPRSKVISMDNESLETNCLISTMSYETGELVQGLLQIPDDTLIIIDETRLSTGKLSEKATRNVQALVELVQHQQVNYDFGGHPIAIPTNVSIISISSGKSILPIEYFAQIQKPFATYTSTFLTKEQSCQIYKYIQLCRHLPVEISNKTAEELESLFLEERSSFSSTEHGKSTMSNGHGPLDANLLSKALNCSRLVAASYGKIEITLDHFSEARLALKDSTIN